MFTSEASRILTIANSAYSTDGYFTFNEWMVSRQLKEDRQDLASRDKENRRKTAITFGVV